MCKAISSYIVILEDLNSNLYPKPMPIEGIPKRPNQSKLLGIKCGAFNPKKTPKFPITNISQSMYHWFRFVIQICPLFGFVLSVPKCANAIKSASQCKAVSLCK